MQESYALKIIQLCRQIDETARDIYLSFHEQFKDEPHHSFWWHMSSEESEHVAFFQRAENSKKLTGLADMFDDPAMVIEELEHAASRATDILNRCQGAFTLSDAFLLAFRMEFYLLHSAFEMLFHLLGPIAGGRNPEDDYEAHIDSFITMLVSTGNVTPELELLGETLQRLWKENRHLAKQATRDDLTGLLNRRGFFATAAQFVNLAQRNEATVGLLMMDLDHFKSINDRLGHSGGDLALKEAAAILAKSLRSSDIIGRYGGEEFIVLLPTTSPLMTAAVAEKVRHSIESTRINGIPLTISIGFAETAVGSSPEEDLQSLIKQADAALYQAKESGRNRVVEFTGDRCEKP